MDTIQDQITQKPEEATSVGMFLKYTRMEQKKNLDAIAKALCIRKIYLKAIEEDDYNELPPVPYGIGFVRSYASYLGLNAERIVQCYKEEALPKKENHKPIVKNHPPATCPDKHQIIIGLIVLAVLYAFWLVLHSGSSVPSPSVAPLPVDDTATKISEIMTEGDFESVIPPEAETPDETSNTDENKDTVAPQPENESAVEQPKETPDANASRVVVKFNGTSWFQISDKNNKIYVSGIFSKGYEYNVPNLSGLIFSVGKYRSVDVYIDGKPVQIATAKKQTNIDLDQYLNH